MALDHRNDSRTVVATACPFCDAALPEQTSLAVHLDQECPHTTGGHLGGERNDGHQPRAAFKTTDSGTPWVG